jgi:hypothetical protein
MLTIQANGTVGFTQAGSAVQVVFSQGIPGPGIDLIFPLGGKAERTLSKSNVLMGFYTRPQQAERYVLVVFQRK